MRTLATLVLATTLATGAACARGPSRPPFYAPVVMLRDVRFGGAGVSGGSLDLSVNVYNPNPYELVAPRFVYRVLVDGQSVASGLTDLDVVIPARDSVRVRLPAAFTYNGLGSTGRTMLSTGSVNYRVLGTVYASTPYGRYRAPYDRAGWFSPVGAVLGQ